MGRIFVVDVDLIFSPHRVPTLKGSYGSCKGRFLIRVLTLGRGFFPVNFGIKWSLPSLDMRFDCAGSHKMGVRVLRHRIFPEISVKSGSREILTFVSAVQVHAKCVSAFWTHFDLRYFTCRFLNKVPLLMSLVKC